MITPRFKAGDFDGGVSAGVAAMIQAVRGEYKGNGETSPTEQPLGLLSLLFFFGRACCFSAAAALAPRPSPPRRLLDRRPPFGGGSAAAGSAVAASAARRRRFRRRRRLGRLVAERERNLIYGGKQSEGILQPEGLARIVAAVQAAEKRTSGEIVPMGVGRSYDYPRTEVVGAGFFALATGAFLAWALGKESLWLFLGLFALFYVLFHLLIHHLPPLKRLLIHRAEMAAEVEEKALVAFVDHGLHRTRDGTGILILISLLERRVHVLADSGIDKVVPAGTWDGIVATVTEGLRRGGACDALCKAIGRCADLLEANFPVRADDTDELPNLILE